MQEQPWLDILHVQTAAAFQELQGRDTGVTEVSKHQWSTGQSPRNQEEVQVPRKANPTFPQLSQELSPANQEISVSTEQDNPCKAQEPKLQLQTLQADTLEQGRRARFESSGVGDIYIFYIDIFSHL